MQKRDNPEYPELKNLLKEILEQQNETANARDSKPADAAQQRGEPAGRHERHGARAHQRLQSLTAQLAPLRELTPQRVNRSTKRPIGGSPGIRASLKAPNWNGVNFLDVDRSTTVTMMAETPDGILVTVERRSNVS